MFTAKIMKPFSLNIRSFAAHLSMWEFLLYDSRTAKVLFFGAMLLLAVVAGSSIRSLKKSQDASEAVAHTHKVILANERLMSALNEAEASRRGYSISKLPQFLGNFKVVKESLGTLVSDLENLTNDNPSQRKKLDRLKELLAIKLAVMDSGIIFGDSDSRRILHSADLMQRLAVVSNQIDAAENELLVARQSSYKESISSSSRLEVMGLFFGLLIVIISYFLISQQTQELTKIIQEAKFANLELGTIRDNLAKTVLQRTQMLEEANRQISQQFKKQREELERKNVELLDAKIFQLAMRPDFRAVPEYWEIAAEMRPATEVGGDYYDFKVSEDKELLLAIGDAAGHGLSSGMVVSTVRSYFQTFASKTTDPVLLNQISLGLQSLKIKTALMGLAILRFSKGLLQLTSAGMPPILIWRDATKTIENITVKSMFLGTPFAIDYETHQIEVFANDIIIATSDGVMEARDEKGGFYGLERMYDLIRQNEAGSMEQMLAAIEADLATYTSLENLNDDITIMAIRVT